jgi:hypothetical protein
MIVAGSITSRQAGENNYYSQNYLAPGGTITTSGAETFFNSANVDANMHIVDSNSNLDLIVQNASTGSGAAVVTGRPSGSANDEWQLIPVGDGYYSIVNKNSGLALVVQNASRTRGARVIQAPYTADSTSNDEWLIRPAGNGLYNFVNRLSGLYLDVSGAATAEGAQLIQWTPGTRANQQFSFAGKER